MAISYLLQQHGVLVVEFSWCQVHVRGVCCLVEYRYYGGAPLCKQRHSPNVLEEIYPSFFSHSRGLERSRLQRPARMPRTERHLRANVSVTVVIYELLYFLGQPLIRTLDSQIIGVRPSSLPGTSSPFSCPICCRQPYSPTCQYPSRRLAPALFFGDRCPSSINLNEHNCCFSSILFRQQP